MTFFIFYDIIPSCLKIKNNFKHMKKFLFLALLLGVVLISSVPAKTKVKSYYSGDAINYNNKLVVASTDSEGLEIFSLNSNGLERHSNWRPLISVLIRMTVSMELS